MADELNTDQQERDNDKDEMQTIVSRIPEQWISSVFSDLVVVSSSKDIVQLNFLQKTPFLLEGKQDKNSTVVARIVLSWPHFIRFAKLINNTVEEKSQKAVEYLEQLTYDAKSSTSIEEKN